MSETNEPLTIKEKITLVIIIGVIIVGVIGFNFFIIPLIWNDQDNYEFNDESLYLETSGSRILSGTVVSITISNLPSGEYILRVIDIENDLECSDSQRFNSTTGMNYNFHIRIEARDKSICMIKLIEWNEYLIDYIFIQVFHGEG